MPTIVVDWGTDSLSFSGAQRVYVRQRWAVKNGTGWDDVPWVLQPNLWCESVDWSLLPTIPSAQLTLLYGRVGPHGTLLPTTQAKLDLSGWWIKIEHDTADGVLSWFGFVDEINDAQGGIHTGIPTGKQTFVCFSIGQILAHAIIDHSTWSSTDWNKPNEPNGKKPLKQFTSAPVAFNDNGLPNRTEEKDVFGLHSFYPRDGYTKKESTPTATNYFQYSPQFWTTRDIIDYLERDGSFSLFNSGSGLGSLNSVTLRFEGKDLLPDWDRPVVQVEGRSLLSVFSDLISTERMLQMWPTVDDTKVPNELVLNIASTTDIDIPLPNGKTHPASTHLLKVACRQAQDVSVGVQLSTTSVANQVVVKGALKETVLTCQVANLIRPLETLAPGWTDDAEQKYDEGASNETAYASASDTERRQLNQIARNKIGIRDVYKVFSLNPYFILNEAFANGLNKDDYYIFNQLNPNWDSSIASDPTSNPKFIPYYPEWSEIKILPVLPFKKGLDYSKVAIPDDDDLIRGYRAPFVAFKHPTRDVYLQAENMSNVDGDPKFSVGVGLTSDAHSLSLDVHGDQQHAIAGGHFTPLSEDGDAPEWKFDDAYMTVSIAEDRRIEASYPADADLPAGLDMVRKKVIYAGDAFRQVRLVPDTVVDITAEGKLRKTQSTLANVDGYFIDDSQALAALARIAAYWHTVPRKIFRMSTPRPSARIAVGQILQDADSELIGTVITQISLSTPLGENLSVSPATFSFVTARGEANPLAFATGRKSNFVGLKAIKNPVAANRNLA